MRDTRVSGEAKKWCRHGTKVVENEEMERDIGIGGHQS